MKLIGKQKQCVTFVSILVPIIQENIALMKLAMILKNLFHMKKAVTEAKKSLPSKIFRQNH